MHFTLKIAYVYTISKAGTIRSENAVNTFRVRVYLTKVATTIAKKAIYIALLIY